MHDMILRILNQKSKMQKIKNKLASTSNAHLAFLIAIAAVLTFSGIYMPYAQADKYDEQIKALNAENDQKNAVVGQLGAEADGLSEKISKLQAEIGSLQSKISDNQTKMAELKVQIKAAEDELVKQKGLLGETIRAMYLEGDISTVEMLATSKDLSDFFDKQQYRESVRSKIKTTLDKITKLKLELNTQKETVEKLLAEQTSLQNQLSGQKAENDRLLSLNQGQQNELDAQIKANKARTQQLRSEQLAANRRLTSSGIAKIIPGQNGNDTYPNKWRNIPQDSVIDSWGMFNRECVSYTAWKVYESGRNMPYWGGVGNANQWPGNARRANIPVDSNPRVGDVAVATSPVRYWGSVGHVMYVEGINGDGSIRVSQYNFGVAGTYSEMNISPSGMEFIHF
jgi:surface antigen/predicted  nucleic acid-binding Zn-ribbon protein